MRPAAWLLLLLAGPLPRAHADSAPPSGLSAAELAALETVEVVAPAPPAPEPEPARPPGSNHLTSLSPGPRGGAGQDLARLLGEVAGVRAEALGGLDSYATLSLRGSSGSQVLELLDGVPLNDALTGAVDLSSLPLEGIERIDVYRGGAPAAFGGQAVGGAVELVSRTADHPGRSASIELGGGSFGTFDLAASLSGGTWGSRSKAALWLRRSAGDFAYHDDRGTPREPADDRVATRQNNDLQRLGGLARLAGRLGGWEVAAFAHGEHLTRGLPGTGSHPAREARQARDQGLLEVLASPWIPGQRLTLRTWSRLQRDYFTDPAGELQRPGVAPSTSDDLTWTLGTRLLSRLTFSAHRFEGAAELRREATWGRGPAASGPTAQPTDDGATRSRGTAALGLEPTLVLAGGRVELTPALRLEGIADAFGEEASQQASRLLLSPRGGLLLRLGAPLELRANVGRYHRVPTFYELFGGKGTVWGNPALQPEAGTTADLGLRLQLGARPQRERLSLEAVVFQRWVSSLITWMQTSQEQIQAANLGEARVRGLELSLHGRARGGFTLDAGYTLLDDENRSPRPEHAGKRLPLRWRHDVDASLGWQSAPETAGSLISLKSRLAYASQSFLDPANLHPLPPRLLLGAELWLRPWRERGPALLLEVSNLLDARVAEVELTRGGLLDPATVPAAIADFAGYPLPGRTAYAALIWSWEEPR